MTTHEILIAAKALIPDEKHWWRGDGAVPHFCHCPITAISKIVGECGGDYFVASSALEAAGGCGVGKLDEWNDAPERSFAELHATFDRAIAATAP